MDILANIALGLEVALTPTSLLYCFIGVLVGTFIGVLPGVGPLAAISMLIPITYHIDPASALIMLAGIWYGTAYGGATTSILLNIPGTTANAVTCLDGYPMAQQGRGGVALLLAALASFFGGTFGIILMMLFAPVIAQYALSFGPAEYFSLMLLGLVAASVVTDGSAIKGIAMVVFGIAVGTIGTDIYSGIPRFTFGTLELMEGVGLVALAMGLFGVTEVMFSVGITRSSAVNRDSVRFKAMRLTRDEAKGVAGAAVRGSGIGAFFGTLPGTGPAISAFMAYALEKRISRTPERFGHGAPEGVVSPEAANNSADQTAFIPTLALGVPGSATMALMLSVLMIHGISPGPALMTDHPNIFWGLIMSFWIGNLMLLVLNIPLIGVWVRLLLMPYKLLYPAVLVFICIGTFSVHNTAFDIWLVVFFGVMGFVMRVLAFPAAPLLLGFVLGPLMEEHFRRAMLISGGDFLTFVQRPISGVVVGLTAILLIWTVYTFFRAKARDRSVTA
jgi:TctA family transporter